MVCFSPKTSKLILKEQELGGKKQLTFSLKPCIYQRIPKKVGVNVKARPKYIAPPPRVRRKVEKEPEEYCDNRYKIVVWTGNKANATSDANVSI